MSSVPRGIEGELQERSRLRVGNSRGAQLFVVEDHIRVAWLDGNGETEALRAVKPFQMHSIVTKLPEWGALAIMGQLAAGRGGGRGGAGRASLEVEGEW